MKLNHLRVPALLAALLATVACSDESNPAASGARANATPPHAAQGPRTMDDDFAEAEAEAPGLGGVYVAEDGTLTAKLTDLSRTGTARSAVARLLARQGRGEEAARAVASMRFEKGEYGFGQLLGWYRALRGEGVKGVLSGDVNEQRNRIVIGVQDAAAAANVRARAQALRIDPGALVVELQEPTVMAARLIDPVRPVIGGVQISGNGYCTLGWNVQRYHSNGYPDGQRYFMTNSHCTDSYAAVTGMGMGQPEWYNHIGTEILDPALLNEFGGCPAGRQCRYSDAALFVYDGSVASSFNQIANVDNGTSGSATIINTRMMNDERFAYIGEEVGKVGRTTGYSKGTVSETCVDIAQFERDPYNPSFLYDTGRTLLCQTRVNGMRVEGGDSGAPAYHRVNSSTRYASGIVWGSNANGGAYSTIYHALREFREADGGFFVVAANGFYKP